MGFDGFAPLFFIVFAGVIAWLGFNVVRHGGVSGMMFGARSAGTVGEVEGKAKGSRRVTVAVHRLEAGDPQRSVGIHMTGKALASVERMGASVGADEARRLANLLERAAAEEEPS